MNNELRVKNAIFASVFGIISNIIVCSIKIVIGLLSGAISIVADGANNLTDALSSVISLLGFKISAKKHDSKHPYGHQRMEYVAGLIVSFIIVTVGVEFIIECVKKIINPTNDLRYFKLNVIILSVCIAIKLVQMLVYRYIGKKINSVALRATALDSRNDIVTTLVVLVGIVITKISKFSLDGYAGVVVGLFIVVNGIQMILETSSPLLGEKPDKELVDKICNLIMSYDAVLGVHDLEIHSYGQSEIFAVCHVEMPLSMTFESVHNELDSIEHDSKTLLNIHLTLHPDPVDTSDPNNQRYKDEVINILSKSLKYSFQVHDFRYVKNKRKINVIFDIVVPNRIKESDAVIEENIKSIIECENDNFNVVLTVDHDYNDILNQK